MKKIVINSHKGGSGKTTLCANLSVAALCAGDGPVAMVDTDPQGTLSTWHHKRAAEEPERVDVSFAGIEDGLTVLRQRSIPPTFCFIDTAPNRDEGIVSLFKLADLVIVPIVPSPADLWSAGATVALLKSENKPFLFVLNKVKTQAAITAQTVASLSHHGPVAETFIADRVLYAAAFTDGRTASEFSTKGPAAIETAALWKNIKACLHANMNTGKHGNMKQSRKVSANG